MMLSGRYLPVVQKNQRNSTDVVSRHTTFIVANPIGATCFGCAKQPSSGCLYQKI